MPTLRRTFLALGLLASPLLVHSSAVARDSSNVVFVGQVNLGSAALRSDTKGMEPLAIIFHDERGPGGADRQDTVSMFRANKNYVDTKVTSSLTTKFSLTNVGEPHDVIFKGSLQVLDDQAGAILDGEYTAVDGTNRHIHVTLKGYQIPYSPVKLAN